MSERRGTKALELWCRRITDGYSGVNVQNMTTSWRDGLAFCAMIHHFRPDLIDFNSLNKDNIYGNNELAFRTAEQHLGIPALLDAEDMASCSVPDRLSILTYLSQFYQVFGGSSPSRRVVSRTSETCSKRIESVSESPQPKVNSRLGICRESCANCSLPVFLAEKLVVSHDIYHRSCFRCARCHQQLTPGNYCETMNDQYCCEVCSPDNIGMTLLDAPLSDEEKTKQYCLEHVEEESKTNDKFDEMIKMISDRIDELTNECDKPKVRVISPNASQRRNFCDNSAPDVVKCEEVREKKKSEKPKNQALKSNSLRNVDEQITKDLSTSAEMTKQFLSIHHRLKFFEPKLEFDSKSELKSKVIQEIREDILIQKDDYPKDLNPFDFINDDDKILSTQNKTKENSTNPFDYIDEETALEQKEVLAKPVAKIKFQSTIEEMPTKRLLEAPQINLNPFWSDDEEVEIGSDSESEPKSKSNPKSKSRIPRNSQTEEGMFPYSKSNLISSSIHLSNTSIASSRSLITSSSAYRKKKPAPLPPIINKNHGTSTKSLDIRINSNCNLSPRLTPRTRKNKPAPAPPLPLTIDSTSMYEVNWRRNVCGLSFEPENLDNSDNIKMNQHQFWNEEKLGKDEANRNTQNLSCSDAMTCLSYPLNKSTESKWKRKKGPAPLRPVPLRRKIKVMSMKDVKLELDQIEMQQQGLEKQGVRLEQIIRDKCETGTVSEEKCLGLDVEELILELFALINEKNELFRRQAELILLRRQQRLEEEHADIEYQIRCCIIQPEATKTDFDKHREEALIQRLVEVVEKRNEIVECLEMDRRREIEEDRSIHKQMDLCAAKNKSNNINLTEVCCLSKFKKGKMKEKIKEKKIKNNKKDVDKDIDETEAKLKCYSVRKWF